MISPLNSTVGSTIFRGYADDSAEKYPEHHVINLPALSPTMEMGTIVSWEKKEGDQVSEGDLLCEIETDKATMGFETPEEGYLAKIILPAGSKDIPIGRLLCIITDNAEDVEKFKDYTAAEDTTKKEKAKKAPSLGLDEGITPKMKPLRQTTPSSAAPAPVVSTPPPSRIITPPTQTRAPTASSQAQQYASGDRPFASPAAKKLAAEKGVDLFAITSGSGMDGMITSIDVESFAAKAPAPPIVSAAATAPMASPGGPLPPMGAPRTTGAMPALMGSGHTDAEITNMRRVIGEKEIICCNIMHSLS